MSMEQNRLATFVSFKASEKNLFSSNVDQKNSNQSIELNWIWLDSIQIDDRWWWWWEHFLVIKSELNLTELNFKWLTDWQPIINSLSLSLSLSLWNWRTLFHCQMTIQGETTLKKKKNWQSTKSARRAIRSSEEENEKKYENLFG